MSEQLSLLGQAVAPKAEHCWIEERVELFRAHLATVPMMVPKELHDLVGKPELSCGFCGLSATSGSLMAHSPLSFGVWWLCICEECVDLAAKAIADRKATLL